MGTWGYTRSVKNTDTRLKEGQEKKERGGRWVWVCSGSVVGTGRGNTAGGRKKEGAEGGVRLVRG